MVTDFVDHWVAAEAIGWVRISNIVVGTVVENAVIGSSAGQAGTAAIGTVAATVVDEEGNSTDCWAFPVAATAAGNTAGQSGSSAETEQAAADTAAVDMTAFVVAIFPCTCYNCSSNNI